MNQFPLNIDLGARYLKQIQKLDTAVFPTCHSIERTWHLRRGLTLERNNVYIHHNPDDSWDIVRIAFEKGELVVERLHI